MCSKIDKIIDIFSTLNGVGPGDVEFQLSRGQSDPTRTARIFTVDYGDGSKPREASHAGPSAGAAVGGLLVDVKALAAERLEALTRVSRGKRGHRSKAS